MKATRKQRFIALPGLKATSCLTVVLLIFLETVLLSTVSNCAKTFFMHWNTSNSIFRIDNTDHIIDVNKGNLAFEYDQVHIICPVYEPGTFDNETEKYIIYNVSKVEYETCRITNANPRIIAICDKPQKLMYFTITFRPFTPQPGGLEFLPGNDYYFISTSSKDDLHRRIGGRCSTNNMKVVFKVCCAPEADTQNVTSTSLDSIPSKNNTMTTRQPTNGGRSGTMINTNASSSNSDGRIPPLTINTSVKSTMTWLTRDNDGNNGAGAGGGYRQPSSTISVQQYHPHNNGYPPTSSRPFINSAINVNKYNKNNNNNNKSYNNNYYNHSNNAPSHKPTKKTNEYDKHPNEVVKNEELTYNNNGGFSLMGNHRRTVNRSTIFLFNWMPQQLSFIALTLTIVFFLNYLLIVQSKFIVPYILLKQQCHTESSQSAREKRAHNGNDADVHSVVDDDEDDDVMECDQNNKKLASIAQSPVTLQQYRRHHIVNYVNKTLSIATPSKSNVKQYSTGHTTQFNKLKMINKISTKLATTTANAKTTAATTNTATTTINTKNNANFNINLMCGPLSSLQHRLNNKNVTITTPTDTKTDIITINKTTDTKYKIQQKYDIITVRKVFNSFYEEKMKKSTEISISPKQLMMTQITLFIEPTTMNYSKPWVLVHNRNTMKNRILERYDDDYTIHELIAIHTNRGIQAVAINEQQLQLKLQQQQQQPHRQHSRNCIADDSNAIAVVNNNPTNSDKILTNKNNETIFKINHIIHSCNNVNTIHKCNCKFSLGHHTDCIRHSNINDKLQLNSIINIKRNDHVGDDDDFVDQSAAKQLICTYTECAPIVNHLFHR